MAVQILGLRDYTDRRGNQRKTEAFFEKGWRSESVEDLFENLDHFIDQIPQEERYNLYYTASVCKEEKGRIFVEQKILPIDVDDIDPDRAEEYVNVICSELDIDRDETGIVFSGNGLQFVIGLRNPITDVSFFDKSRHLYRAMCGNINQALYAFGLQGNADTSVFSGARLLRLPSTENRKPGKGIKAAYVINDNIVPIDFDLSKKTGLPEVMEGEHIHPRAMSKLPEPDRVGVQEGCDFLKHCHANQEKISEPQWYAMLSIIGRLPGADELVHEYSKGHAQYSKYDTDRKWKQSIESSGPRTCSNIESVWNGCNTCENYGKCKSPIMLKGDEHIATRHSGFYDVHITKTGTESRKPNYDDLVKFYNEEHPYSTMDVANIVHIFNGKKWADVSRNKIHSFAEDNFDPSPNNQMCSEFESKLKRTKIQDQDWFQCEGMINFDNGVLHLKTGEFLPHSPEYGFKYVLPFKFDPNADCPRFEKFLSEITLGRDDLQKVLIEFMGYSLAGVDPQLGQKALIMYGDGANGKSVFIEILRELAGKDNYSTLSMGNEINKLENRYQLSGKLFNVSEETPSNAMVESSVFKALVSGGEVQARKLYCDAFSMRNYAKIIMACNELPASNDMSHGMLRRLLIIPFDATFTRENRDIHLVQKLQAELSGIFNLAMAGYRRFIEQNGFTSSSVVEEAVKSYVEDNDTVQNFLVDECEVHENCIVPVTKMYSEYAEYCYKNNIKPINVRIFGRRIKQLLFRKYQRDMTNRSIVNGRRQRVYHGIGIMSSTSMGRFS